MFVCISKCIYTYIYVYIHMIINIYIHTHIHIYVYVYIYICVYVCMYICICVCVYVYMYMCTHMIIIIYVYTHIHIYIHTDQKAQGRRTQNNGRRHVTRGANVTGHHKGRAYHHGPGYGCLCLCLGSWENERMSSWENERMSSWENGRMSSWQVMSYEWAMSSLPLSWFMKEYVRERMSSRENEFVREWVLFSNQSYLTHELCRIYMSHGTHVTCTNEFARCHMYEWVRKRMSSRENEFVTSRVARKGHVAYVWVMARICVMSYTHMARICVMSYTHMARICVMSYTHTARMCLVIHTHGTSQRPCKSSWRRRWMRLRVFRFVRERVRDKSCHIHIWDTTKTVRMAKAMNAFAFVWVRERMSSRENKLVGK